MSRRPRPERRPCLALHVRHGHRRRLVAVVALTCLLGTGLAVTTGRARAAQGAPTALPAALAASPLHSDGARIVDAQGRQVLLRGANVNSLGEYWQGLPSVTPTIPVTDADWEEMAAHGFSVVRLLITWSRVEPTQGAIDSGYLDLVDDTIRAAAAHGISTVLDMHQDAYTATISTTDPSACPPGTAPAKGWDGAPAWAVRTGGASTCLVGSDRNSSPAVTNAWNAFYDDVDGIRTAFSAMWGAVAARFAGRPEVVGYDLLNEPEVSRPSSELAPLYNDLLGDTVRAIRAAEASAPFEHLIFVEPAIPAGDPGRGIVIPDPAAAGVATTNIVAAPHNYAESITPGISIETMAGAYASVAEGLHVPVWIGEYGFWDTSADTLAKVRRYAADEDARAWGGAWWQWRQSCGDPHSVRWDGNSVVDGGPESVHLNTLGCPGNVDLGPTLPFLQVLGRGYPRATPGRIDTLTSNPDTGLLQLTATVDSAGGQLVVWTPTTADPQHRVQVDGLDDVVEQVVPGGRIVTARVSSAGTYRFAVGPDGSLPPLPTPPAIAPSTQAPPALAVPAVPTFTG